MPLEDAIGIAGMLVSMGRAIPPREWLPSLAEANPVMTFDF